MNKLRMKFSALNVVFDGLNLDFLGLRKPGKRASKSCAPAKVVILPSLASPLRKRLQPADHHGHAAYHNKHYDERFSRINVDDFEKP